MAQIMGGLIDLLQAGFAMSTRASTSSPTLQRQLRALRSIRAVLHCGSRATPLGASMHTMQALVPNPYLRHGGPLPWGTTVALGWGKRFCPASDSTAREGSRVKRVRGSGLPSCNLNPAATARGDKVNVRKMHTSTPTHDSDLKRCADKKFASEDQRNENMADAFY